MKKADIELLERFKKISYTDMLDARKFAEELSKQPAQGFKEAFKRNWGRFPTDAEMDRMKGEEGRELITKMFLASRNAMA